MIIVLYLQLQVQYSMCGSRYDNAYRYSVPLTDALKYGTGNVYFFLDQRSLTAMVPVDTLQVRYLHM
jgi:hypothetical protein